MQSKLQKSIQSLKSSFYPFLTFKLNNSLSPHGVSGYLKLNLESYCRFYYLSLFTFSVILVNLFS